MNNRLTLSNLNQALKNPTVIVGELSHQLQRINSAYHRRFIKRSGQHIMEADWDNLIILDACRYDMFRDVYSSHFDGELKRFQSQGSCTLEFLMGNFDNHQFHDTIYISSNPHTRSLDDETFYSIQNLFLSHWSPKHGTVHPEDVVEQTIKIYKTKPDKRLISHFMQPHEPFIGKHSDNLPQAGLERKETDQWGDFSIWTNLRYRIEETTLEEVIKAYEGNLEFVLPYVKQLVKKLDGKTVITSDHGNLLGERLSPIPVRGYGHPWYIRHGVLVDVPWLIIEDEGRRRINPENPIGKFGNAESDETVNERLQSLGYK